MSASVDDLKTGMKAGESISKARGPAYPYIDLPNALTRLGQIVGAGLSGKQAVAPEALYGFWGLGVKSSSARSTLAAMKYYGLVEYTGTGKERRVRLTERAMVLAHDTAADSPRRVKALREAALSPDIFGEIYAEQGGPFLPPKSALVLNLTLDKNFDKDSAEKAVDHFLSSVAVAGLDKPQSGSTDEVDQSPAEDATVEQAGRHGSMSNTGDTGGAPGSATARPVVGEQPPRLVGCKEDTYSTVDGDVTLRWPVELSAESLEELEEWCALILRKIKREVHRRDRERGASEPDDTDV